MSRKVPANRFDDAKRELIIDMLARGCSQPVIAKKVGCSGSTVHAHSKRYASDILRRAAVLAGEKPTDAIEVATRRAVEMSTQLLDELGALTKKKRMEKFAANATACARLLKELHHVRQLTLGQPTSRSKSDVTKTETVTVVEPITEPMSDPLGILRNRLS